MPSLGELLWPPNRHLLWSKGQCHVGDEWYSPGHTPRVAPRKPNERVWTIRKPNGHTISAWFQGHGEYGWEVVLLRDGDWFYGHRFDTRALAEAEAAWLRAKYLREGSVLIG
jgi:hypothetical protein